MASAEWLGTQLVNWRRDFHRHAETAWQEFRTAAIIAEELHKLGFSLKLGRQVIAEEDRMGVPADDSLEAAYERALNQGAPAHFAEHFRGGFTGVVGELDSGKPGPTVAVRIDIDANDLTESASTSHRPVREGFSSLNPGAAHACGHDGHAAIGLGVATLLVQHIGELCGVIRLIFQPAEEGTRGAKSMTTAGVVEGVDYFLSGHVGFGATRNGEISCGTRGFLATSKADVYFTGVSAHAGANPESGRNALLAAASTALALHGIPRHSAGASRINVGILRAGEGRNVIPPSAHLVFETRGATSEIDAYMMNEARRIIAGQAQTYGVEAKIVPMGGALGAESDLHLVKRLLPVVKTVPGVREVREITELGGSEDVTYMMERVKEQGGLATYFMFGTAIAAPHHNCAFDFDESVLPVATHILFESIKELCQ